MTDETAPRPGLSGTLAERLAGEPLPAVIRTLSDLRDDPERLITPTDMARIGLAPSYAAIRRWVSAGGLPEPYRTPGGRELWRAGDVLAAFAPRHGSRARPARAESTADTAAPGEPPPLPPLTMTIANAERYSGLSKSSLYERLARGDIAGVRAGRRTLILTDSLRQHIERQPPYRPTLGRKAG
jgi:hypothetical protein